MHFESRCTPRLSILVRRCGAQSLRCDISQRVRQRPFLRPLSHALQCPCALTVCHPRQDIVEACETRHLQPPIRPSTTERSFSTCRSALSSHRETTSWIQARSIATLVCPCTNCAPVHTNITRHTGKASRRQLPLTSEQLQTLAIEYTKHDWQRATVIMYALLDLA